MQGYVRQWNETGVSDEIRAEYDTAFDAVEQTKRLVQHLVMVRSIQPDKAWQSTLPIHHVVEAAVQREVELKAQTGRQNPNIMAEILATQPEYVAAVATLDRIDAQYRRPVTMEEFRKVLFYLPNGELAPMPAEWLATLAARGEEQPGDALSHLYAGLSDLAHSLRFEQSESDRKRREEADDATGLEYGLSSYR